jgi:hypothetical protein
MRKPLFPTLALLAFGPGAALYFAPAPGRQAHPVWSVANWPFPMDQRGPGQRSLQSERLRERDHRVLARQNGFLHCTTGVADDEELERLADFELFSNK